MKAIFGRRVDEEFLVSVGFGVQSVGILTEVVGTIVT